MEIIFGIEFFFYPIFNFLREEVFLKKKTFVLPGLKSIKFNEVCSIFKEKKLYLGLSLLFPNSNSINGVTILDCKKEKNIYKKLDEFSWRCTHFESSFFIFFRSHKKQAFRYKKNIFINYIYK